MKIQQFRNATMAIEAKDNIILLDPMLGPKGSLPPFTFFRYKPKRNPIVDLPTECNVTLEKVTHALITHLHPDHLDSTAEKYIIENDIEVSCSIKDVKALQKKGFNLQHTIEYWKETPFLNGSIMGIPAQHGYGFIAKPAGNVMGYFIQLPEQPSLYISSDTIFTKDVKRVFQELKPDISVVAAGSAQFDIFRPLLMTLEDILLFIKDAPGKVIANHMEAVNHCPTTRQELKIAIEKNGLTDKCLIPEDGEWMNL